MNRHPHSRHATRTLVGFVAAGSLALAACSPAEEQPSDQQSTQSMSASASESNGAEAAAQGLTFTEAYVTAKPADKTMTGVFGTLTNNTDKDIHLTSVKGSLKAEYQFHVVVDGQMKEATDGFTIKAGEKMTLQPGHEHIMLMDIKDEIAAGDTVDFTLTDADGKTYELPGVPVRVQQSTHEHYGDAAGHGEGAEHSSAPGGAGIENHGEHEGHGEHHHG